MVVPICAIFVGTLALLASLPITLWMFIVLYAAWESRGYPAVIGTVDASRIVSNRKCNRLPGWHYVVTYTYKVDGNEFCGTDVRAGRWPYLSRRIAQRTADRYPQSSVVNVYYSPDYPEASLLERGWSWECAFSIVVFLVAASTSLCLLVIGIWRLTDWYAMTA